MVAVVVVLGAVGLIVVRAVDSHLLGQVDRGLINSGNYLGARIAHNEFVPVTEPADQLGQGLSPSGQLLGESANIHGMPPLVGIRSSDKLPLFRTIHDNRFGYVRLFEQRVTPHGLILVTGQQINEVVEAGHSLTELLAIILPLLAVLLGVLIWIVVSRTMRRVEGMRGAVAEISDRKLDDRIPLSGSGDELDRLAVTMNGMLDRLTTAVTRERRFVADASHELRSPIASLHAAFEVSRRNRTAGRRWNEDAVLSALQRLDILAEELLVLDSVGRPCVGRGPELVDIDELVLEQVDQLRHLTELDLDVGRVSGGQVFAREVDMMRIIENLSSNACRHAVNRIGFAVTETEGRVLLSVTDDGPGIPDEMRVQVFERFARLDSERSRHDGGSGLGLAIVTELVESYGGRVWVESALPHGARFVVELPAPVTEDRTSRSGDVDRIDWERSRTSVATRIRSKPPVRSYSTWTSTAST
jgi:signal transduction histidine kinase